MDRYLSPEAQAIQGQLQAAQASGLYDPRVQARLKKYTPIVPRKRATPAGAGYNPNGGAAVAGGASAGKNPRLAEIVLPQTRLLSPIRNRCFQTTKDYWTYELCPMRSVRQFRLEGARIASEFSRVEEKYPNPMSEDEIYNLFKDFKYIVPQGSPMSGIGNPFQIQSLSNCFVISSPEDSYGGILYTDQQQVQIMKRRGGVGFDISNIRPRGKTCENAARTTDGIGVFMERFSNSCREVAQGGRRGALMLSISVHHPQVMDFIKMKQDLTKVTGANVSVRVTDEFMEAVKAGEDYKQRWPVCQYEEHEIVEWTSATKVWDALIECAHNLSLIHI